MAKRKRPTIHEVSRLSGVSVATVSRVIHGESGRFSAETEARVRLNYEPDILAQGMCRQTLPVVGVIMPDILDDSMALMMRTVQEVLFERNYSTVFFNSDESAAKSQRYFDILHAQHAAGVIYVPDREGVVPETYGIPVLCFDRTSSAPEGDVCIVQNNYECSAEAVGWLARSGCRRVAVLGDRYGISMHTQRMRGATDAIGSLSLEHSGTICVDPQKTTEAFAALRAALDGGMRLDGIFCTSVRLTVGAMSALKDRGKDDVRVAGYGVHRLYRYGLIDYMAIYEPIREMSIAAAERILAMINGEAVPGRQVFESRCLYAERDRRDLLS